MVAIADRWWLAEYRNQLVDDIDGRVLDLGCGTGRSFPYIADAGNDVELHALEPDPFMRRRARERATHLDLEVTIHAGVGESLPFEDDSIDVVISSLVLCTVDDLDATREEIARVLKPAGELRMLEHVQGAGIRGRLQSYLAPLWRRLAGGCELVRRQHEPYLADSRFEVAMIDQLTIGMFPIKPLVIARFNRSNSEDAKQR